MAILFDSALASYLDHLRIERSLSPASIDGYRRDLNHFGLLISDSKLEFAGINDDDFGRFIADLSTQGLATPSINRFISAVKGFYKYCALEYGIANPLQDVKTFKVSRKLPKAISIEEVESLIRVTTYSSDATSLRDRLVIELLYGSGARVAELVAIDINDISSENVDGDEVTILKLRGKGSKERLVPLGKFAVVALNDYLVRLRPSLLAKNSQSERALFLNSRGKRLTRQSAWSTVLRAAKATNLEGRVSPHVFRHSYATH
ncbi:MAG: tyrosine-type recombinase/integrase, partial [Actinobacteria bacterium]|nr:tyrosine-type recombinase/integrase [Actinomycetota bacterium]